MKLSRDLGFACSCGSVRGHVKAATSALHFACHCKSCVVAERHFHQPDPGPDGVGFLWVAPDRVVFDAGKDLLAAIRLTDGPLLRWYATCCDVPMLNIVLTPRLFILGLLTARIDDTGGLGPKRAHAFVRDETGKTTHQGSLHLMRHALGNTIAAAAFRRWSGHPFLDENRQPIRPARLLSDTERAAAGL